MKEKIIVFDQMLPIIHLANTDVEFEFSRSYSLSLEESWKRHSLCLQLQFLPLLYAQPQDLVAVTTLPDPMYLETLQQTQWWPNGLAKLVCIQEKDVFRGLRCYPWGHSREVQMWASERDVEYVLPTNWETICQVNSKAFSFRYSHLKESALLSNEAELKNWLKQVKGKKILKTCFGLSGMGNRLSEEEHPSDGLLSFCRKEWECNRPVIGEPWLNRCCDFSTQWMIHPNGEIEALGTTRFQTDQRGNYLGTLAGPEERLFLDECSFIEQHREIAKKALQDMSKMGFYGNIGIDALLYKDQETQTISLYPIVEINARQTMSLVALRLQQRLCPHAVLSLAFEKENENSFSFLPKQLMSVEGKQIAFRRYLTLTRLF